MCIKNPIYKTCWKNGKDLSNEAPKIKLWKHTKKTHFPVLAKNFRRPWMKLKIFFANFQILGPLGCQGWVVIPRNVKKAKITAPYWGSLITHCAGSVTTQRKAFKYVMASESYRYTWYLKQVIASLPYIKIDFILNTYSIEMKKSLSLTYIFLDSQQIFRKVCKKLDFSPK